MTEEAVYTLKNLKSLIVIVTMCVCVFFGDRRLWRSCIQKLRASYDTGEQLLLPTHEMVCWGNSLTVWVLAEDVVTELFHRSAWWAGEHRVSARRGASVSRLTAPEISTLIFSEWSLFSNLSWQMTRRTIMHHFSFWRTKFSWCSLVHHFIDMIYLLCYLAGWLRMIEFIQHSFNRYFQTVDSEWKEANYRCS